MRSVPDFGEMILPAMILQNLPAPTFFRLNSFAAV
jgi:hypothetical protein